MTRGHALALARRQAKILTGKQIRRMKWRGYRPVAEAAAKVGLSVPRIYQLLEEGTLAGTREGGRRYVRWASLRTQFPHAFARGRRNGPQWRKR